MNNPSPNEDDSKARARRLGFALVALLFLAAWILGYVGYDQCYWEVDGKRLPWWELAYLSFQLFGLEYNPPEVGSAPAPLVVGRSLALLFTASAALLALAGICRNEICALRLARLRGHAVVCGAGKKAEALIRDLLRAGMPVVAIDLKTNKPLPACGVFSRFFVIQGDATRAEILARAQVRYAAHIFVMTGNDSANIEIASRVIYQTRAQDSARRKDKPVCHVHMVDRHAADVFRNHSAFKDSTSHLSVRMFNIYDNAARLLWRHELVRHTPVAPDNPKRFHAVIAGVGEMGEAVMLRVIRSAHFANGRKPAFTLIDRQANRVRERLAQRHPVLESLCDIDWIDGEMGAADTQRRIVQCLSSPDDIGIVAICADDDHGNFATALRTSFHLSGTDVPIFVRLSTSAGLTEILKTEKSRDALAHRIKAFGLVTDCCTADVVLEERMFCFAHESHGTHVVNWAGAGVQGSGSAIRERDVFDGAFRESNCERAEHLDVKRLTVGIPPEAIGHPRPVVLNDEQIEILARMEHARKCAERKLSGWTYAPPPENIERRTSPELLPWEELDESTRERDRKTVQAIALTMVELTGSCPAPDA